jgi:hypothetical protein
MSKEDCLLPSGLGGGPADPGCLDRAAGPQLGQAAFAEAPYWRNSWGLKPVALRAQDTACTKTPAHPTTWCSGLDHASTPRARIFAGLVILTWACAIGAMAYAVSLHSVPVSIVPPRTCPPCS